MTSARLGVAELSRLIAAGDVSVREVVEMHIRRIEATHTRLNAVVVPLFEQACAEAEVADAARQRGQPSGPLTGIPITIKESFDVAGTPTTLGVADRRTHRAAADAPLVARLRAAGAIVLGKTNASRRRADPDRAPMCRSCS